VDIDDERWGQSGHEVPETTVNDEIEWGNIQQSTRGGGADGSRGVGARRRGIYDCGNVDEERRHLRPKMGTSWYDDHRQHQREAFDN